MGLRGLPSGWRDWHALLQGTDIRRGPESRSAFFLWLLLEFFLFDVLHSEFLLIAKAHLQEAGLGPAGPQTHKIQAAWTGGVYEAFFFFFNPASPCASYLCESTFLIKNGKFPALIVSNISFSPFALFF